MGLHSCAGLYNVVEFEILEPATVSFPDHISQLLVINRSPFTMDIVSEGNRTDLEIEHLLVVDTLATNSMFHGMHHEFVRSPIERFHTPLWFSERRRDTASLDDLVLTKREVNDLCIQFGADAIISLEQYSFGINEMIDYFPNTRKEIRTHYFEVFNKIDWCIYLPNSPRPFDTYSMVDTLFFTHILDGEMQNSASAIEMLRELFYHSGARYGRYLVPVWTSASRLIYRKNGDTLKLASKYTDRGDWENAYALWNELIHSNDSSRISKAYNNLAIYHELEDNLDSASRLIDLALKYDTLEAVRLYREELDNRLLNRNEIIKQVR